jgi:hypothetical protein
MKNWNVSDGQVCDDPDEEIHLSTDRCTKRTGSGLYRLAHVSCQPGWEAGMNRRQVFYQDNHLDEIEPSALGRVPYEALSHSPAPRTAPPRHVCLVAVPTSRGPLGRPGWRRTEIRGPGKPPSRHLSGGGGRRSRVVEIEGEGEGEDGSLECAPATRLVISLWAGDGVLRRRARYDDGLEGGVLDGWRA